MKISIKSSTLLVVLVLCGAGLLASCSDWTESEPVGIGTNGPDKQDPAKWAAYMADLKAYKQSSHIMTYVRLNNAPEVSVNEKDFLRSMPDSLDFVALYNSDRLSRFDIEDIPAAQQKSTRVLYYLDYTRLADKTESGLKTAVDAAIGQIRQYNFDGVVLAGNPILGDGNAAQIAAARVLADKLSAFAGPASHSGKVLFFDGDPAFLSEGDIDKFDYFILNTANYNYVPDMLMVLHQARDEYGIDESQMFFSTQSSGTITTLDQVSVEALPEASRLVLSQGPLAGLAMYDIGAYYYDPAYTYKYIGWIISELNASPKN